ncbi:OAS [Mytilus coruscus]|uniref:OAS n=1 Tax=Mytilus coruscus TaxID=42192 RepID=A0A6J8BSA6_MYTCO|nr:OAS [Mytilus coruscus]
MNVPFQGMYQGETLECFIDRHVRPNYEFLRRCSSVIDRVVRIVHLHPRYSVSQVIKGGSLGKGTGVKGHSDVDLLVVLNDFKTVDELANQMDNILDDFSVYLSSRDGIRFVGRTPYTLQFQMMCDSGNDWHDVDLLPIIDVWSTWLFGLAGGPTKAYKEMVKKPYLRKYYAKCLCKLQIEFVKSRPCRVKDLIRLIKYWNKTEGVCIVKKSFRVSIFIETNDTNCFFCDITGKMEKSNIAYKVIGICLNL